MTSEQVYQDRDSFNNELLQFLDQSPTPYHAVAGMADRLRAAGFEAIDEADAWQLRAGGRYFTTRNDSSLIAFVIGANDPLQTGIRLVGAHTDSPCLKLKPIPELREHGCLRLGIETYGGVLLNPWFDRDLSLAGRINLRTAAGELQQRLVNLQRPIGVIPSLAIHLDRGANESRSVNAQKDMPAVIMLNADDSVTITELVRESISDELAADDVILDFELSFYDTQPAALGGWHDELIRSARLDNLLSCFIGLQALLAADGQQTCVLVCNDHEEVGSQSAIGAQGPMLEEALHRICNGRDNMTRVLRRSMLISADNAHALHPNFADKHDSKHGPKLNAGPVLKYNANQRYASSGNTAAVFRAICAQEGVPLQSFVSRADMACGSTIGPLTASVVGVPTLDIGVPQWGMHSVRETAGSEDAFLLCRGLRRFFHTESVRAD